MVNSGSFDSDVDRNEKDGFTQSDRVAESPQSAIPMHVAAGSLCENDFATQTADSLPVSQAIEPTATKTEYKCNMSELFVGANEVLTLQCNSQDDGVSLGYSPNSTKTLIASAGVTKSIIVRDHDKKRVTNCLEVQSKDSEPKTKPSVCCSVPLEKIQDVLKACNTFRNKQLLASLQSPKQTTKKDMCLYCDRTFITSSLKQKHVDRSHSSKHNRRLSARRQVAKQSLTACMFCEKLNDSECTLKQLFEHLASAHPRKYFGCLDCEIRFPSLQTFQNHNIKVHGGAKNLPEEEDLEVKVQKDPDPDKPSIDVSEKVANGSRKTIKPIGNSNVEPKTERLKANKKPKSGSLNSARNSLHPNNRLYVKIKNKCKSRNSNERKEEQEKEKSSQSESEEISPGKPSDVAQDEIVPLKGKSKANWAKELRSKKISVLSTKVGLKQGLRTTRQRTKILENAKNSKRKIANNKIERTAGTNVTTKYLPYTHNPYPSFDFSFRVKKITDHSIDNIRISSMTFDDVFDKAFFNRVKSNIHENLLNYIDGKLFKSVESENRISSFQKTKDDQADEANQNCGSKLSSNAITPVAALLSTTQFGEDLESQIEYGAKPSKKKTVVNDEVHYKYFTRRKYQAVISESREHRDLSKLDMWTQLVVKNRQQKISSEHKTDKEILEYTKSDEYKIKMQVEELNTILDKRGPLEDLKEEAIRTVALEKLNGTIIETHIESYFDVTIILDELLNGLFSAESCSDTVREDIETTTFSPDNNERDCESPLKGEEIPNMLNLRRVSCVPQDRPVENSPDYETDKTAIAELTGEWARSRIYVCAACGTKVPNAKSLIDHKNLFHEHVWCQHYEFVGNQGELYRHLSIPALGKIGQIEESSGNKMWRRSDSRVCSKCNKRTNCLGDLHRHILECGGDWSWMLARKKYKYRPYGSRPRKKKRGLLRFLHTFRERKVDQARDKRKAIKKYTGPRQKPSDADTIERMLANLPAKRITRKVMSMKDGFQRTLKNQKISKANKGKPLRKQKLGIDKNVSKPLQKNQSGIKNPNKPRRVLRSNSAVRFENKNMILPKFKKEVKGNNSSNLKIKRHSVRNINKVLPNKIRKSSAIITRGKLADKQEEVAANNSTIDDSKKDVEPSDTIPSQNITNQTINSVKKAKVIKLKKKNNNPNARKVRKENKSVANVASESTSEDFKPTEDDTSAIPAEEGISATPTEEGTSAIPETISTNAVLEKSDLEATVSPSHANKKQPASPTIKQKQKKSSKVKTHQKNSHSNEGDISSSPSELQLNPENQLPVLAITQPLLPKITKKKKKKSKLVFKIKTDSFQTKDASKDALDGVQPQEQYLNKNVTASVRTSCRKRAKINNVKPVVPSLKIATKKMKPTRIKKKITKIVQVDGSSQSTPSTRSKSTKKEFFNSVFLCASNDHTSVSNNMPEISKDLGDLSTLDTTITATAVANESSDCCTGTDTSHIDETLELATENNVENETDDVTVPHKVVEEASNDNNKSCSIILDSSINRQDTKEQSILAPPNLIVATSTAKKKSTKKLRGLNDCIAMLTNKLQDKGSFHTNSSDNAIPVIAAVKELPNKAALIHSDILPKKYGWQNNLETNITVQNDNDPVTTGFMENLSKPIEKIEEETSILHTTTDIQRENSVASVAKNNNSECNSKIGICGNPTVKLNLIEFLPLEKFSMEQFTKKNFGNNHSISSEYSVDKLFSESNNHITLKMSSITNDHNLFAINKTNDNNTLYKDNVDQCVPTPQTIEVFHETKWDEIEETAKTIEDSPVKNSLTDTYSCIDTQNIFEKEFSKSMDVTVEKNKSLKAKITFGQNFNADNILQLQTNAPAKPKKSVCKRAKVNQKQKKKKSSGNKSLKSNYAELNKRKNNLQDLEFIKDTEMFSDSAQNILESRIEINDSVSDMKLVQNLADNDQEALLNTSDEFSNSGKENLIINKIIKVPKHRKSKTAKTKNQTRATKKSKKLSTENKFQKNVVLLKLPKEDVDTNPIENTVATLDTSEFIDSEDDIPLAQFINKSANCNPATQSKSDALSPDLHLCEEVTVDEVKENLCESKELESVNEAISSVLQEKFEESSAKSVDDEDALALTNGLLPEVNITNESQLPKSRKIGELRVIVQLTNLKSIRKKRPKISANKVKKQKKFTKHRKRKNADITLTDNKQEETLIRSDNLVADANKFSVESDIITEGDGNMQTIDKEECDYTHGTKSTREESSVLPNEDSSVCNYPVDNDFINTCSSGEIFNNIGKENLETDFSKAEERNECSATGDGMINEEQVSTILLDEYANLVTETIESLNVNESENEQLPQETIKEAEVTERNAKVTAETPPVKTKSKSKANSKKAKSSKSKDSRNAVNVFCNICNKTFTRTENLVKHKRTLTHIAKLSELEALEVVKKANEEITIVENLSDENTSHKKCDLNISDILCTTDTVEHNVYPQSTSLPSSFAMAATQDSLKLVDIINDVLSKPVEDDYLKHNNFSNLILKTDLEVKRCKSLGERKSFDCDKLQLLSNSSPSPTNDLSLDSNFVTTKMPSTADVIVEKQISLLENMIEDNRINFNPNDKVFISSELPITEEYSSQSNSSEFSILSSAKPEDCNEIAFTHNTNIITNLIKPTLDEDNLMQATQYEEISEDSSSSHFQFEEQKSRKVLNRDEELFLECCSLLKSSSDVSDLCKKSSKSTQFLNNFGLKPLDELEWLEQKQLPQKNVDYDHASNIVLEDSHINNSVDHFCNDMSYSNSSTSNCNLNMKILLDRNKNDNLFSQPPIFEDISAGSEDSSEKSLSDCFKNFGSIASTTNCQSTVEDGMKGDDRSSPSVESAQIPEEYKASEDISEEKKAIILKLGNTKSKTIKSKPSSDVQDVEDPKISTSKTTQPCITDYAVSKKVKKGENRKMLTKGAMKVFEGLKVSIPKEGLDMKEVLSCSPTSKRLELEAEQESANVNKKVSSEKQKVVKTNAVFHKTLNNNVGSKKTVLKKFGNKLGLKIKKKCQPHRKNTPNMKNNLGEGVKKSHDIYDFEETQDSIDVFAKHSNSVPIYHSFRNKLSNKCTDKNKTVEKEFEFEDMDEANSNCEDSTDVCNINKGEKPSAPTVTSSTKKINNHKSITKKKCMIMGRIFKNAIKSKTVDEIKNIPVIENSQKVEDYVQNCHSIQTKPDSVSAEHKLSEEEMNILFDNLLNEAKPKEVADKNKDRNSETGEQEPVVANSPIVKNTENKSKLKGSKCKKRPRGNSSDSSDEEFSIKKVPKKHCSRKNSSNNECVINLEQELKECIGVASRKSQRKCTSGKQNVLVEYWSSDESSFDIIEPNEMLVESPKTTQETPVESATTFSDFSTTSQNYCNDNVITNDKEQEETEPTVLPLDTNTYDTNSSNSKEKKKQAWSESPPKTLIAHNKKKGMPKIKKVETGSTDREATDSEAIALRRQKRTAVDTLYYWSSSSEDELQDVIEVKPIREEYDDEDRPLQQGWIVGDSPKKLVTMLAQAKGKKVDAECVKKNRKKRTSI